MRWLILMAMCSLWTGAVYAQDCKFLNESCTEGSYQKQDAAPPKERTFDEHLERCLAGYIARGGRFVPEGQSTGDLKSKSDMTSMCKFAIENHNYYWDHPKNPDREANYNCCMKMMNDAKQCMDNLEA